MRKLLAIVQARIPKRFGLDPIRDIQVLCPMNRGGLGARSLNIELQNALNPPGEVRIERFGWTFCPGDKVMQIENDYDKDVYNGDLGVVSGINVEEGELTSISTAATSPTALANSTNWYWRTQRQSTRARARNTGRGNSADDAALSDAATQSVYTGVTRGKRLVILVGQRKAVAIAVKGSRARRRWSKLREDGGEYRQCACRS